MRGAFGRVRQSLSNCLTIFGSNNRVFNIINGDGTATGFTPQVDWNTHPQAGGDSAFLEWRTRLTPLIGRDVEVAQLLDWADESAALSFKVIQAAGGIGKTRLAAEVAQRLADGKAWSAGFVSLPDFCSAARLDWVGNWFLIVDYPEHSPQRLAELLRAAKAGLAEGGRRKLRILLLSRTSAWLDEKFNEAAAKGYLSRSVELTPLPESANYTLLQQALVELSSRAAGATPQVIDEDEFEAWLADSPLHPSALFVLALAIHLSNLPMPAQRFLPGAQLLADLVNREMQRWRKAEDGLQLAHGTLADVIALATLFNGLPASALNNALATAYGWSDATRKAVFGALTEVWPADAAMAYPPMAPDLLAAAFLWQWQADPGKQGNRQDHAALVRLAGERPAVAPVLLQRWHMQAYDQTMRLMLGKPERAGALGSLLQCVAAQDDGFKTQLRDAFASGIDWPALATLAAFASQPCADVAPNDLAELAEQGRQFNNHSIHLSRVGDRAGALQVARDAVAIFRHLVDAYAMAFESDLAMSVHTLSNRLSDAGDWAAALQASREAVDICRRLTTTNPADFEPDLAMGLNGLARCLIESGARAEACQTLHEAVEIDRRLLKANSITSEHGLAASVTNLANCLDETGDHAGGLKAGLEAVGIYRRLSGNSPANFESHLAMSVGNLAAYMSNSGDRAGALQATREAVDIYRRLSTGNPAEFELYLALNVNNLAGILYETGDRAGARSSAEEALRLYERLNSEQQGLFDKELAGLHRFLERLSET